MSLNHGFFCDISDKSIHPLGLIRRAETVLLSLNTQETQSKVTTHWATVAERKVLLGEKPHRQTQSDPMKLLLQSLTGSSSSISHSQASHFFNFSIFFYLNYICIFFRALQVSGSSSGTPVLRGVHRRIRQAKLRQQCLRVQHCRRRPHRPEKVTIFFFVNIFCWEQKASTVIVYDSLCVRAPPLCFFVLRCVCVIGISCWGMCTMTWCWTGCSPRGTCSTRW